MGQIGAGLDRPQADQIEQQIADFCVRRPVPPTLPNHRCELRMRKPAHFGERDGQAPPIASSVPGSERSQKFASSRKVERSRIAE